MRIVQQNKICTGCGIIKPRSEFHKKTNTTVQPKCKPCHLLDNKLRYVKNKDKYKETKKVYYQKNKEEIIKKVKNWNKNHPKERSKYMTFVNSVRRGRKLANGGTFTKEEWLLLIDKHEHKCYYCKQIVGKLTIDHYIPLSKGGSNFIDNIVPACFSCNCKKGNKLI